jgi:ribosome maturation factor RimP
VQFKDGKKTLDGRIKSIDGDDVTVTVKGDGDYEMKLEDLIPID